MTTYLKDLTQSIGRYGGLSKQDLGLRVFGCTSSISTWCGIFWLAKIGASTTCWRIYDNITSMRIWTNINHYVVFLVQRQQFLHIIFWWGLTIRKGFQDSVFACESSLPYINYSWIACMTNIVIVKPQKISLSKPNVKLPLGMIWFQLHDIQLIQPFTHRI